VIGLCGAHGTGKTTLAEKYAEKHKSVLVKTTASAVFAACGLDPSVTYDFSTRLSVQEMILDAFDKVYAEHSCNENAIADRTPLDLIGYTMAEAVGDFVPMEDQLRLAKYVKRCFDVLNKRFSTIIVVQPGIPIALNREGKAASNLGYIEHLNSLILGLSVDERVNMPHFYLPRNMTALDDRVQAVEFSVGRSKRRALDEVVMGARIH